MKLSIALSLSLAASLTTAAGAANIYMLSSLDAATDAAAISALTSRGHTVTLGVDYTLFDGTIDLSSYQTVYLQSNYNWTSGIMPDVGQQQLINWVNAGGRLVTSEWVIYYTYAGGRFGVLGSIIPAVQSLSYGSITATTYTQVTHYPEINAGLPESFNFTLTSFAGTETYTVAKSGATTFYSTSNAIDAAGLMGWTVGTGSVYSFTSTCGPDQVADANFGRLFSNVMGAAGSVCGTADFNGDGDFGTDADIEAFFACLAGSCCSTCWHLGADFNADGDAGTDGDIESFFRVLAAGPC